MQKYYAPDEAIVTDQRDLQNVVTSEIRTVYLASEVDSLLHELRDLIQRCAGGHGASDHPCYRRDLCDKALALMER